LRLTILHVIVGRVTVGRVTGNPLGWDHGIGVGVDHRAIDDIFYQGVEAISGSQFAVSLFAIEDHGEQGTE